MLNKRQKNHRFFSYDVFSKNRRKSPLENSFFPKNHKAQVSETMTWVIATIVIVFILAISIYITGISGIFGLKKEVELKGNNDLLVTKSFMGYLSTKDSGESVYKRLTELNFEKRVGKNIIILPDLAKKIFEEVYYKDYPDSSWMGFILVQGIVKGKVIQTEFPNAYFGGKEGKIDNLKSYYYNEVWLDKEGKIGLELIRKD